MESISIESKIQTCGSYDPLTDEYSLTIGYKDISLTLDGLNTADVEELQSCLNCLLM